MFSKNKDNFFLISMQRFGHLNIISEKITFFATKRIWIYV